MQLLPQPRWRHESLVLHGDRVRWKHARRDLGLLRRLRAAAAAALAAALAAAATAAAHSANTIATAAHATAAHAAAAHAAAAHAAAALATAAGRLPKLRRQQMQHAR